MSNISDIEHMGSVEEDLFGDIEEVYVGPTEGTEGTASIFEEEASVGHSNSVNDDKTVKEDKKSEDEKKRGFGTEKCCSTAHEFSSDSELKEDTETPINIGDSPSSLKADIYTPEISTSEKNSGGKMEPMSPPIEEIKEIHKESPPKELQEVPKKQSKQSKQSKPRTTIYKGGRPKGSKNKEYKNQKVFAPQPGPQEEFLSSVADCVIYGGARGGGKSFALFLESLRHIGVPGFNAVFLRTSQREIIGAGQLWDTSYELYSSIKGSKPVKSSRKWEFPSGAKIEFAGLDKESAQQRFRGASLNLILFDEVQLLDESSFWFLLTCNRSTTGISPYIRCSCNPDPDSFVARLISWWIGPEGYPIKARSGVVRYFMRDGDMIVWADTKKELLAMDTDYEKELKRMKGDGGANLKERLKILKKSYLNRYKSLTFIGSLVTDNKILMEADETYISSLAIQDRVSKERDLMGNWLIRGEKGDIFDSKDFKVMKHIPELTDYKGGVVECRMWDFSYVVDYTASVKMRKYPNDPVYYVVDVTQFRLGPAETEDLFLGTSMKDKKLAEQFGINYMVRWEEEGASAAKKVTADRIQLLAGFNCAGVRTQQRSKRARALPFAVQVGGGNVALLEAEWNDKFKAQHHAFTGEKSTKDRKDDMVDCSSYAFAQLTSGYIYPTLDLVEKEKSGEVDIMEKMLKDQEELENDFLMCNDLDD